MRDMQKTSKCILPKSNSILLAFTAFSCEFTHSHLSGRENPRQNCQCEPGLKNLYNQNDLELVTEGSSSFALSVNINLASNCPTWIL